MHTHKHKPRLNARLCPEKFEICVPRASRLLVDDWRESGPWLEYVSTLDPDYELPPEYDDPEPPVCWTCDCKLGWKLSGKLAVAHACQVHDKIHRQLLGFEQVSAVDVGFAIQERQTKFGNFLAIRIHVNRKLPPEQLVQAGLNSFTGAQAAFTDSELVELGVLPSRGRTIGRTPRRCNHPNSECPHPDRWRKLIELLKRTSEGREELLRDSSRYPISGVRPVDLSIFCPPEEDEPNAEAPSDGRCRQNKPCREVEPRSLDDIRLCICGVPIDIVNARYNPSVFHPGGDATSGVFVEPSQRSNQLGNDELLHIGQGRTNPLVGGISVGSVTGQAGTLGVVVWDRTDGTPCILSNWHVLAGTARAQVDQPTYQPALFDGGTEDDMVARLKRWHLGEEGDAAIAELTGDRYHASGEILGLWHPVSGSIAPRLNLRIRKWGRTTGFTQGFVDGIHLATNIDYGGGVVRYFKNQFHIAPLHAGDDVSQVGDSGSLVVTSFRPIDMQDHLVTLCEWLRQACENQDDLCRNIVNGLAKLREDCPRCCKPVCELLDGLDLTNCGESLPGDTQAVLACCKEMNLDLLRDCIEQAGKDLKKECLEVGRLFTFCACLERELEELHEKCCRCRLSLSEVIEEIGAIISCCNGSPPDEVEEIIRICCVSPPDWIRELLGLPPADQEAGVRGAGDDPEEPPNGCSLIELLLVWVRETCSSLEKCIAYCRRVDQTFEEWQERCSMIQDGRDLCQTLHSDCQDPKCENPRALVKCIKKKLKATLASKYDGLAECSPPYGPEEIRCILNAVVDAKTHNPEIFLKEIKGTARRYYRRKKVEADQNANRVYYAVGLIFAGDTPGSPFGEFAVASNIESLADQLRFSLRPVFEPRSSFRELRVRPPGTAQPRRALRSQRGLTPGVQRADLRAGGPQPDVEPDQGDPDG